MIHIINDTQDVEWIVKKGSTPPYIAALYINNFSKSNLLQLKESERVVGVMLLLDLQTPLSVNGFSPETSCPNDRVSLYLNNTEYDHCAKQSWNPNNLALSMLYEDWGFPIFLITNTSDINHIENCFIKYSKPKNGTAPPWPLCSAELSSRMNAAKDSKTCMRRNDLNFLDMEQSIRYCDPLSSFNIFAPLFDFNHHPNSSAPVANKSLIVVSSRIDSSSLFSDLAPGADSSITSITVLLTVASTLSKNIKDLKQKRKNDLNVLFALFDGESFDYIGSSKAAYDMQHQGLESSFLGAERPIDLPRIQLQHLKNFIELSQLAPHSSTSGLWIHTDPLSRKDQSVDESVRETIRVLMRSLDSLKLSLQEVVDTPLPPASLQSFLRHDLSLPGVMISNHKGEFTNQFYNSFLDNKENIKFNSSETLDQLTGVATLVSRTLYEQIVGEPSKMTADRDLVKQLLECFLVNVSCPLFSQVFQLNATQSKIKLTDRSAIYLTMLYIFYRFLSANDSFYCSSRL